jgi:hypothetical protein
MISMINGGENRLRAPFHKSAGASQAAEEPLVRDVAAILRRDNMVRCNTPMAGETRRYTFFRSLLDSNRMSFF